MADPNQQMQMNPQGQPPPQYQGQPQQGYPGQQPQTVVIAQPQVQPMVVVGGCPHCGVGQIQENFTCLGIFCAICCFPLGLICCFMMKDKKCTNCGKTV